MSRIFAPWLRASDALDASVVCCIGRVPFNRLALSRSCGSWLKMRTALPVTSMPRIVVVADVWYREAVTREDQ